MNHETASSLRSVFLTGATGVLGGRLLLEMLLGTDALIYCLVRADSLEEGKERIGRMLAVYAGEKDIASELWRVIPVPGSVSEERFGLDSDSYDELARTMDLAFHCAASVSLVASFRKLAPVNVGGTERMVEFCLRGEVPLVHVSSFSVVGDQLFHERTFLESELDVGQGFAELGYERSKFTAEKIVREASAKGLTWTIVRPGNIWGDSESGCYPLFETRVKGIYYEILKSLLETGYTYPSDEDFDVTPVDYVAKATLHAGVKIDETAGRTFHLTNPEPVTHDEFADMLRMIGYTLRCIDGEEYFEALYEDRMVREGKPYRSTYTDLLAVLVDESDLSERCRWDTSAARALLADTDIVCPPTTAELIGRYCAYAASQGFVNRPGQQRPLAEISDEMEAKVFMQHLYDEDPDELGMAS